VHKSGIVLVLIPAGEFMMGSPEGEPDRSKSERRHRRMIRKPFYLGETEVTVAQFRRFVKATGYETDAERGTPDGGGGKGAFAATPDGDREWTATASWQNPFPNLKDYRIHENHPVVHVSWNDAQRFCEHYGLRLPSEAQWEYACRAGSAARFPWGESDAVGKGYANLGDLALRRRFASTNVFFPFDDGVALVSVVGRYKPNSWMLRDMIGNVEEWCQDAKLNYPEDGADESAIEGDISAARVLRGGGWIGNQGTSRASTRIGMTRASRRDFQGFRVAATIESIK
jgi:formylglycine-generating enzyme required for sulfatase activity